MRKVELRKPGEVQETLKHQTYQLSTELPTKGATMLDGYPLIVRCNPFTVGDIKTLVYSPDDKTYYETLAKTIDNLCDINVLDLCVIDFKALIHFMRVNVCGFESSYVVTCGKCKLSSPFSVDLRKMKIGSVEFVEGKVIDNLTLALPRVKARMEFDQLEGTVELDRWAMYITNGETAAEKIEIYNKTSPKVLKELATYSASLNEEAGVNSSATFKCPCGEEESLTIPFRGQFFLPEYPTGDIE